MRCNKYPHDSQPLSSIPRDYLAPLTPLSVSMGVSELLDMAYPLDCRLHGSESRKRRLEIAAGDICSEGDAIDSGTSGCDQSEGSRGMRDLFADF